MASLRKRFGERLRELRNEKRLTQEALAEKCDISVEFISNIERGVNAPSFDVIEKLAAALKVKESTFFEER